jgi:phosphoserine phosphatase RsbU/P
MMMSSSHLGGVDIFLQVLISGAFAVLYAWTATRRKFVYMALLAIPEIAAFTSVGWIYRNSPALENMKAELSQLHVLAAGGISSLAVGYTLFIIFFSREGIRYFRAHTEIALAQEIHRALVPEISTTSGSFEIFGASIPSGEVGGDLADFVQNGDDWTAYVADVSGHGVSPGVLMAMFKTAVRTRILANEDAKNLLEGVHEGLYPLKTENLFVTAGFLRFHGAQLTLSLAGHTALLHYRKRTGEICEYPAQDLPVGIFPQQTFTERILDCESGDILLLLTDGITEVFDQRGNEMGIEPVKVALRKGAGLPLPALFKDIRETALHFGRQQDDQTMLLVRRRDGKPAMS